MEDQRNWTDASYKTYVRPLALPWPYTLAAGAKFEQAITLTVTGRSQNARAGLERRSPSGSASPWRERPG